MFDFADIQMSPVDGLFWATSSDSCTSETGCNDTYVGENPSSETPGEANGMAIRQSGGPKLKGPLPVALAAPGPALKPGPAAQPDTAKPVVRLAINKRSFKVRKKMKTAPARFTLRMSEPATVIIQITVARQEVPPRGCAEHVRGGRRQPARLQGQGRPQAAGPRGLPGSGGGARQAGNRGRSKAITFRCGSACRDQARVHREHLLGRLAEEKPCP